MAKASIQFTGLNPTYLGKGQITFISQLLLRISFFLTDFPQLLSKLLHSFLILVVLFTHNSKGTLNARLNHSKFA